MNKTITINGTTFEIKKGRHIADIRAWSLYDAYDTPSSAKTQIYNSWRNWFNSVSEDTTNDIFTIGSYNTFMFTLEIKFTYNAQRYHARITPSHNYLWFDYSNTPASQIPENERENYI